MAMWEIPVHAQVKFSLAAATRRPAPACVAVWRSGSAPKTGAVGFADVTWAPAQPGTAMFSALAVTAGSGDSAFFARPC